MDDIRKTMGKSRAAGLRLTGFLVLLALAVPVASTLSRALGGEASWVVDGAAPVAGTLTDAAAAVTGSPANSVSVVTILQGVGATGAGTGNNVLWNFNGTVGARKDSVTLDGGTGQTLTGNGSSALAQIRYADVAALVHDLTFSGGTISAYNPVTMPNASGAGLSILDLGAGASATLTDTTFIGNKIALTDVGARAFQGGGLAILHNASGTGGTVLMNVNLRGNSVQITNTSPAPDAGAWGGGAYVSMGSAVFNGGIVEDNRVSVSNGMTARGGGLAFDRNTTVELKGGLIFRNNVASASRDGSSETWAMGGAVHYGMQDSATDGRLTIASGTSFLGNQATASMPSSSASVAIGGALALTGQIESDIGDASGTVVFKGNKAASDYGQAGGGAIAVISHDHGGGNVYQPQDMTITNGLFEENSAEGRVLAQGGAIMLHTPFIAAGGVGEYDVAVNGGEFKNNKAESYEGAAYGGALYADNRGDLNLSGAAGDILVFSGNSAVVTGDLGDAAGGAVFLAAGDLNLSHATVSGNKATTVAGVATGGGLSLGEGEHLIADSTVTGNIAASGSSATGTDRAMGGGVYVDSGSLTVRDSQITNNEARTGFGFGYGSAIFMNTNSFSADPSYVATVTLDASAGEQTVISGNKTQGRTYESGIFFGDAGDPAGASGSQNRAALNITGAGDVLLLNPVEARTRHDFTLAKTSTGDLTWGGTNVFDADGAAASLDLRNGVVELTDDFTARAEGDTDYHVAMTDIDDVRFSASRDGDKAMFDYTAIGDANDRSFTVTNSLGKTDMTITIGREVKSFYDEYLVVAGLDKSDAEMQGIVDKFKLRTDGFATSYSLLHRDGDVLASVGFRSPFDDNTNSVSAQDALESLVKGDWGLANISDAEFHGMLNNARNITPELAMEQGFVMMQGADWASRSAVDHGMRAPHLSRLKIENTVLPASYETYEEYEGGYVEEEYEEYYESAYPSLVACDSRGLRMWAGYIGEWRNQDAHGGFNGYRLDRNGVLVGGAYDFGERAAVGLYGGYSRSNIKAQHVDSAKIRSDVAHLGVTARFSPVIAAPAFSFYGDAGYHWSDNDSHRNLSGWDANGSFDQSVVTLGVGVEHVFYLDRLNIRPYAEGRYFYIEQDGFTETGSSATATRIDGFDDSGFNTRLGVEFSRDFLTCGMVVSPTLSVDWRHEYGTTRFSGVARFVNGGSPFIVSSARMDRDSADIKASIRGAKNLGTAKLGFNLAYNLNLSRNAHQHSVYAGMDLGF